MDKLKYIKIKQEDGSYSEEIPVGADANNIDMSDGRTLPETLGFINVDNDGTVKQQLDKLNKDKVDKNDYNSKIIELENKNKRKASYYNSVSEMKTDTSLKDGMTAVTLGYYEPNDGGISTYRIRTKIDGDVDDGAFIHELSNGNVAELICEEYIRAEVFGAKGDGQTDNSIFIEKYLNSNYNKILVFSNGTYCFSRSIEFEHNCRILITDSTLKYTGEYTEYFVHINSKYNPEFNERNADVGLFIKGENGIIDCGNSCGGVALSWCRQFLLTKLRIVNILKVGLNTELNPSWCAENSFTDLYIGNIDQYNRNSIGIIDNGGDNVFDNIVIQNLTTGVYASYSYYNNIHYWNSGIADVGETTFAHIMQSGAFFECCYMDTVGTGVSCNDELLTCQAQFINCSWFANEGQASSVREFTIFDDTNLCKYTIIGFRCLYYGNTYFFPTNDYSKQTTYGIYAQVLSGGNLINNPQSSNANVHHMHNALFMNNNQISGVKFMSLRDQFDGNKIVIIKNGSTDGTQKCAVSFEQYGYTGYPVIGPIGDPQLPQEAATKNYVDTIFAQLQQNLKG